MISKLLLSKLEKDPSIEGLKISANDLEEVIKHAIDAYYNSDKQLLSDSSYDILEKILKEKKPSSDVFKKVGASIKNPSEAVKLPYYLGSLDKVYPNEKTLSRWIKNHNKNILISEKLDGLSSLLVIFGTNNNVNIEGLKMELYKHGDGIEGQDISHLLNNISIGNLTRKPLLTMLDNSKNHIALRGEIIIKKDIYEKKYNKLYPKARSLIAGIVNSKNPDENIIKDMEIVFYEFIYPNDMKFEDQFKMIEKLGFNIARYKVFKTLEESQIPQILLDLKKDSKYEIDGIVLDDSSKIWPRATKKNPEYAVAFKMQLDDQIANTIVTNVEYNISKHGILAPRIEYKPVVIKGDTHKYTSGFNLKYIVDNKINIGTEIQIIKSGDVIPYINQIFTKSKEPLMPSSDIKWHWNETHVDAVLDNPENNDDVLMKKLAAFFSTLKISGVAEGVINKFINAGYTDLKTILELNPVTISQIEGFQLKSATNVYNSIHKIIDQEQPLERVMMASGVFTLGLGEKKFKLIIDAIPNFLKKWSDNKITKHDIINIPGFNIKTTDIFMEGMPKFIDWLNTHNMIKVENNSNKEKDKIKGNQFVGMNAVFTGIRDENIEQYIIENGGIISSGISSKTTILIAKDITESSSKIKKAKELGIEIINYDNFKKNINYNCN